ncbi:class I SAM-dependent methyltransferase [Sphingobacterium psychroaquaticum]|uniref:Ubiquinone/menaquinone biosynthesis C-methylase UbiE n=1 Tax=Sphingobacterium psychroaquaticum TaxID=561061 RepID=A0A1X7LBS8_9SPHI|nr:class I SAM-dependent methyltransferase [Sphingobacterium psychroaquaticum]QBQ40435.1 class I SAM-dependent methyltransferase [Sphingobacterium psychroaquaticum]SMG51007.1 Ubiquinone/menaquinone biosynthesis C-methylase UbiE [Sphingobacterium psychroaquaticum]
MDKRKDEPGNYNETSYEKHANWYHSLFPDDAQKIAALENIRDYKGTINHWLQEVFFSALKPFIANKKDRWLTVGDAYGHDAMYLLENGVEQVLASDLNDNFLQFAQQLKLVNEFAAENAENLSFATNSMDYILCKESYHHFPRPYAALYEMIRVAKKGIIIIEPQDPISKMPLLLFASNLLEKINQKLIGKIWKNRFSYEPVGNFVYKVSEREFEKFAAGLNLPLVAIKMLNPNFWFPGSNRMLAHKSEKAFKKILFKKKLRDVLSKWGIVPCQTLSIVVFKEMPDQQMKERLSAADYKLIEIPTNPYL